MQADTIIFYFPLDLERGAGSGSAVRPAKMAQAFEDIGYEVICVTGDSSERAERWQEARKAKDRIIGVYAEVASIPSLLADKGHFPKRPFTDFRYFRYFRRRGCRVVWFYRDLHWLYVHRMALPLWKRAIKTPAHILEILCIAILATHVCTPSRRFHDRVPVLGRRFRPVPLPPGGGVSRHPMNESRWGGNLEVLYVGGVTPPLKDLSCSFRVLSNVSGVRMTVCCGAGEWREVSAYYRPPANVEVVHASGDELVPLYERADVVLLYRETFEYHEIAMPVKVFESVGFGVPLIVQAGTAVGDFVSENDCGWVVGSDSELLKCLEWLKREPSEIARKQKNCHAIQEENSWLARGAQVARLLHGSRHTESCEGRES